MIFTMKPSVNRRHKASDALPNLGLRRRRRHLPLVSHRGELLEGRTEHDLQLLHRVLVQADKAERLLLRDTP